MTMTFARHALIAAIAGGTMLVSGLARAQETITINIGSSHPVTNIWVYAMQNSFQPEVDRLLAEGGKYKIEWVENYGGTLYKFSDTRAAVSDGIVDIGMVGTLWEGSAMPLQNVTYFTPFATDDHELLIEVYDKLNAELPELQASWEEQNMVYLSAMITDSYDIYATFPISTLADLQNRKINAPGTAANWLRDTGATPVDGALTTYYTNVQTGVTEGALSFASGIYPIKLHEVAKHLTRVGIGSMVMGAIASNKTFFDGLPPEVQEAIVAAGRAASKAHGEYVSRQSGTALEKMAAEGLQVAELPAEEKRKWVETLPNIIEPWLQAGGEDAKTVLKAYFAELRARGVEPIRAWDEGL
jgi:C4-dicarboxylate-binding protein DctP